MAFATLIFSCKSNEDPDPKDGDPYLTAAELQKAVLSKWSLDAPSAKTLAAGKGFIEFLGNNNFIFFDGVKSTVTGKFNAKADGKITLENFGELTELKPKNGAITFKLTSGGKTSAFSGNKVEVISTYPDRTKTLCQSWVITNQLDGAFYYDEEETGVKIDKATVFFSPNGTYLFQIFYKNVVLDSSVMNWKWHATFPDRIQYWEEGGIPSEGRYLHVNALSEKELKIIDHNGVNSESFVLTFN